MDRPLTCLFAFACATGPSVSWAQTNAERGRPSCDDKRRRWNVQGVQRSIRKVASAFWRRLSGPIADADIPAILSVVIDSDDSPISIENAADRKPGTTLFVLSSLSHETNAAETIKKIADTTAYVTTQYTAYVKTHPHRLISGPSEIALFLVMYGSPTTHPRSSQSTCCPPCSRQIANAVRRKVR
jgi:hypothetical protein